MSEKKSAANLVEVRKDIYKMRRTLSELETKEQEISGSYDESVATNISNHAIVQFCDRLKPDGFDMDLLRLIILEYVSKAKLIKERKDAEGIGEYFYECKIDDVTVVFLVKGNTLVTVWKKDGPDV